MTIAQLFRVTPYNKVTLATHYVPYIVSTTRQRQSGLEIEAQQAAVRAFVQDPPQLLTECVVMESGKKNQRPQLLAAIAAAWVADATLLIARLNRLSRNVGFIFTLRNSGVAFVCCDMPDANTLTVGLFAVIAQHEREIISKHTGDALIANPSCGVPRSGARLVAFARIIRLRAAERCQKPWRRWHRYAALRS